MFGKWTQKDPVYNHPLMKIKPRRLHAPKPAMRIYGRRHLRDLLLKQGLKKITVKLENVTKRHGTMVISETEPDLDLETRLLMCNTLNTYMQKGDLARGTENYTIYWNLVEDAINTTSPDLYKTVHYSYPDPCYSTGRVHFNTRKASATHLDPELPKNIIPESMQVIDTIKKWKTDIADILYEKYPDTNRDSMQAVIDYIEPHMPLAWQPEGRDEPSAVWNLHQFRLSSLNRKSSVMMSEDCASSDEDVYHGLDHSGSDVKHPLGTHLVHDGTARYGYPEYNHCSFSIQGIGSLLHAQLIAASILRIDWPIPDRTILKDISQQEITSDFCHKLQSDVQALVSAVIQDDEMLEFLQQYERIDVHLFCNFLKKHPHLREGAKKWPGVMYSAMIGYLSEFTEEEARARYNCFHTGSWKNHGRWGVEQYSTFGVGYNPRKYLPYKNFKPLVNDPKSTLQDWFDAFYSPEIQEQHPPAKMSNLLEKFPMFHRNELHQESPNDKIPHELGKRTGEMRPEQSLLLKFLKPESSMKEQLLHLPIEKMPSTELEWVVAEFLCLGVELPSRPDQEMFTPNMLRKGYEILIMTGLWKHYLASSEKADDNEFKQIEIIKQMMLQVEEIHDIMNVMLKMRDKVANLFYTREERRKFRHDNHKFLREFSRFGKKKVATCVNLWGQRANQFMDEKSDSLLLEIPGAGERPLMSWVPLLEEEISKDGYSVREISSAHDLKFHASRMSHCVGIYVDKCMKEKNSMHVLEFRKSVMPVATASFVEGRGLRTSEFRGRNNSGITLDILHELHQMAFDKMQATFTKEWHKEACKYRKDRQKKVGNKKYGLSAKDKRILVLWNWHIMGRILPGLPPGPYEEDLQQEGFQL